VNIYTLMVPEKGPQLMPEAPAEASLFQTVPPKVVQSIRAFRVTELQAEAARWGQDYPNAHWGDATKKHAVLKTDAQAFLFPRALGICITFVIRFILFIFLKKIKPIGSAKHPYNPHKNSYQANDQSITQYC